MYHYDSMKIKHSKKVCQTINSPIMVFDYFELSDVALATICILFFGIVLYSFPLSVLSLVVTLGIIPIVKRRYPKGILFHIPYKKFGMSLPGLINPGNDPVYSD